MTGDILLIVWIVVLIYVIRADSQLWYYFRKSTAFEPRVTFPLLVFGYHNGILKKMLWYLGGIR